MNNQNAVSNQVFKIPLDGKNSTELVKVAKIYRGSGNLLQKLIHRSSSSSAIIGILTNNAGEDAHNDTCLIPSEEICCEAKMQLWASYLIVWIATSMFSLNVIDYELSLKSLAV